MSNFEAKTRPLPFPKWTVWHRKVSKSSSHMSAFMCKGGHARITCTQIIRSFLYVQYQITLYTMHAFYPERSSSLPLSLSGHVKAAQTGILLTLEKTVTADDYIHDNDHLNTVNYFVNLLVLVLGIACSTVSKRSKDQSRTDVSYQTYTETFCSALLLTHPSFGSQDNIPLLYCSCVYCYPFVKSLLSSLSLLLLY
jgi:hypothetical protein